MNKTRRNRIKRGRRERDTEYMRRSVVHALRDVPPPPSADVEKWIKGMTRAILSGRVMQEIRALGALGNPKREPNAR